MPSQRPIYYLSEKVPHWGHYTGYRRLPHYMASYRPAVRHLEIKQPHFLLNQLGRLIGNHKKRPQRRKYRNLYEWFFYYYVTSRLKPGTLTHILSFHAYYLFLARWPKAPERLIYTIHLADPARLNPEIKQYLGHLSSAIVLYRSQIPYLETIIGPGRVKFVHYGVDVDFFRPAEPLTSLPEQPRFFFVGQLLRDTARLARLIQAITVAMPQVCFDLLISQDQHDDPHLQSIRDLTAVTFHTNISDHTLRQLYQQSYLLLLPLFNAGANTTIVEALACGLPIVTNDVGGVPDYGGGTIYPTAPQDDTAMLDLIERYLTDFKWRNEVAAASRDFALNYLAWPRVARQHEAIYQELCP